MSERCRSCRAEVEFLKLPTGGTAPMQKVTQLYEMVEDLAGELCLEPMLVQGSTARVWYINHFQTCPDAAQFTRKR